MRWQCTWTPGPAPGSCGSRWRGRGWSPGPMPAWHSPSPRLLPSPSLLFWVAWPEEEEEGEMGEGRGNGRVRVGVSTGPLKLNPSWYPRSLPSAWAQGQLAALYVHTDPATSLETGTPVDTANGSSAWTHHVPSPAARSSWLPGPIYFPKSMSDLTPLLKHRWLPLFPRWDPSEGPSQTCWMAVRSGTQLVSTPSLSHDSHAPHQAVLPPDFCLPCPQLHPDGPPPALLALAPAPARKPPTPPTPGRGLPRSSLLGQPGALQVWSSSPAATPECQKHPAAQS